MTKRKRSANASERSQTRNAKPKHIVIQGLRVVSTAEHEHLEKVARDPKASKRKAYPTITD